jgi:fumarate reductase flavoprotein subunit
MSILPVETARFDASVPILIVGGGACGLVAALAAREHGAEVLVLERDEFPGGSTALSSGMIPAAGTRAQRAAGISDTPALFARDIQGKSKERSDPTILRAVTRTAGPAVDWLSAFPEVTLDLVDGFLYPGHSVRRMHAPPDRTGRSLIGMLTAAAEARGVDLVTGAHVTALFADAVGRPVGARLIRPDGSQEDIGCAALILACNGFGGNPAMVAENIPEMAGADYFGHVGNRGDAVTWGVALGGEAKHMTAYQGHGSVATPHGILITWALMMEGGIQVNAEGARFANEHQGYSEQVVSVLNQPGRVAWNIFDARLRALGRDFEDFRQAEAQGAVREAETLSDLVRIIGAPERALAESLAETESDSIDRFGRDFSKTPALRPPYFAVKVTGALFHTQGGLRVDDRARVLKTGTDTPLPGLYAGGGAACGVSGPAVDGYLSGNGLLTAIALGYLAGRDAATHLA